MAGWFPDLFKRENRTNKEERERERERKKKKEKDLVIGPWL
jgi:hypothetical protein